MKLTKDKWLAIREMDGKLWRCLCYSKEEALSVLKRWDMGQRFGHETNAG